MRKRMKPMNGILCKVLLAISIPICVIIGILVFNQYKIQKDKEAEYRKIALIEREIEQEQIELEKNSNFYEKLDNGFDTNLLVLGDSIALSEGASDENDWIRLLIRKIEDHYAGDVFYKNLAFRYKGCDVGYTQIATLDVARDYDAVLICFPACADENELVQYEAMLAQIKKKFGKAAILGVISNSSSNIDSRNTISLIEHYEGACIDMPTIINDDNSMFSHDFYPNDQGYELYAEEVFRKVVEGVNEGKLISEDITYCSDEVRQYENCIYIPLRKCRHNSKDTVLIDLDEFSGKICVQTRWGIGYKAYDIYYDNGNWLTRNEMSYDSECWYDSFMFHEVPHVDTDIMIQFSEDVDLSEIKGFYLISENPINLK